MPTQTDRTGATFSKKSALARSSRLFSREGVTLPASPVLYPPATAAISDPADCHAVFREGAGDVELRGLPLAGLFQSVDAQQGHGVGDVDALRAGSSSQRRRRALLRLVSSGAAEAARARRQEGAREVYGGQLPGQARASRQERPLVRDVSLGSVRR